MWTFGIITHDNPPHLDCVIDSIRDHGPSDSQIVLVGGNQEHDADIWIPFNDLAKNNDPNKTGWITKKKNLVGQVAKYENLCIMHDYISLEPGWSEGVESFGSDWLTCMHRILNSDNARYRDWCVIFDDAWMDPRIDDAPIPRGSRGGLLDYELNTWGRWQYYSGAYFCVKRSVLAKVPMNEGRVQNGGEDVEWSRRLYEEYGQHVFSMNPDSSVKLLKHKGGSPIERTRINYDFR